MLNSTSVSEQYEQAGKSGLRVLVTGAGMAGLTVAQLLRGQGVHPVLIERHGNEGIGGYMLALMPMVDRALDELRVRGHYRENSEPLARYRVYSHAGRELREDPMAGILGRYGDYRGISRGELVETLTATGCHAAFGTTVAGIRETDAAVEVTLNEGGAMATLEFDVVIVAEGIGSSTRDLLLPAGKVGAVDTGWGGWVVWADQDHDTDLGDELWGAGFFLGVYPVKGQLGVFLGGAREDTAAGPADFVARVRNKLPSMSARADRVLSAVADEPDPFYWPLKDCRAERWAFGRTVLLGDAAAGFLPTAGIGAGMAIESAWVLARILGHADRHNVPTLLQAYEQAQRPRVEAAQNNSRQLASLMFRQSKLLAIVRDFIVRVMSVEMAVKSIQRLLVDEPDPDAVARAALKAAQSDAVRS
ncbi:FAD-dependent oxidoreductase [Arthrobacter castelli]|uniref:FAD-dependent oxidoreductase n=1 Tax=Arthrobacter castelli TaxID=271431 RepID=UPI000404F113|nr:NAD(P)/FAD-dependent oxidoreductase [Arthrobacter castelli]